MITAAARRGLHLAGWLLVGAVCITAFDGCTAWKKKPTTAEAILATPKPPKELRITLADSSRVELSAPYIQGDSLVGRPSSFTEMGPNGWVDPHPAKAQTQAAVPLADIRVVEVRQFSAGRTVLLVVGIGAAASLVAYAIGSDENSSPFSDFGEVDTYGSSCPLLYSWDGRDWILDSGTFGGAFLRALAYADFDNLDNLAVEDGVARLRLDAGVGETDYVDDLTVLAVDHDPSVTIATDPAGRVHTIGTPIPPLAARDTRERDALGAVSVPDGRCWESALAERDTSSVEDIRDALIIEFPRPAEGAEARLILKAQKTVWASYLMRSFVRAHGAAVSEWYAAMDAQPAAAAAFRQTLEDEVDLSVSLMQGDHWVRQAAIWGGGPEVAKTHAIPLDLSQVSGETVRVRLESAPSLWVVDWVALDSSPERSVQIRELPLESAVGPGGQDVRAPLRARDGDDLVLNSGDAVNLRLAVPGLPDGKARTYLSRTYGWYRFHAPGTGPADSTLLDVVMHQPRGISRSDASQMNATIRAMNSGR